MENETNQPAPEQGPEEQGPITGENLNISGSTKQVKWLPALLLSIFVGGLGVDRFYMGQMGLGAVKLITCGGMGVWALIDIVLIATKYKFKGIEWVD